MLFVVYAALVWWAALSWRRRWLGFASVALGVLGVWFVARFYLWLGAMLGIERTDSFMILMAPFGVIVGVVGGYIACLPVRREGACRKCGYSLMGLEPENELLVCPECGARHAFAQGDSLPCSSCGGDTKPHGHRDWVCSRCGLHLLFTRRVRGGSPTSAEDGAVDNSQGEHAKRKPEDDDQPQPKQAGGIDAADQRDGTRLRALGDQLVGKGQPVER